MIYQRKGNLPKEIFKIHVVKAVNTITFHRIVKDT